MDKAYCVSQRFGYDLGHCYHDRFWHRLLSRFSLWHQAMVNIGFFLIGVAAGFYTVFKEVFKEIRRDEKESKGGNH